MEKGLQSWYSKRERRCIHTWTTVYSHVNDGVFTREQRCIHTWMTMYSPAELEGTSARENEAEGSGFGQAAEGTGFFLSSTCFHVYFSFAISPFLFLVFICLATVLEETSQLSLFFLTFCVFLYSFFSPPFSWLGDVLSTVFLVFSSSSSLPLVCGPLLSSLYSSRFSSLSRLHYSLSPYCS